MEVDDSEEWPDDNNSDWVLMELADDELELLHRVQEKITFKKIS